jgi:hypothetical protein
LPEVNREEISELRLILGLLRELLFVSASIQLFIGEAQHEVSLQNIVEPDTRTLDAARLLQFQLHDGKMLNSDYKGPAKIRIGFGRFVAIGQIEITGLENGLWNTTLPALLEIKNARGSSRNQLDLELKKPFPLVVVSSGRMDECILTLDEISGTGCGGILEAPEGAQIAAGSTAYGTLNSGAGSVEISCVIARIQAIHRLQGRSTDRFYRVGLKQLGAASPHTDRWYEAGPTGGESITLVPLLKSAKKFKIGLSGATMQRFKGHVDPGRKDLSFPLGSQFNIESSSLIATLTHFDENEWIFSLTAGDQGDRIEWAKRLTPYFHANASTFSQESREILNIFCESGALSKDFLKTHRAFEKEMLQGVDEDAENSNAIYRWISKNQGGTPNGHISALRLGDNCWVLGDIAGSQDSNDKIPKDFIASFFTSFRDLTQTLTPSPNHMIMWVSGHPYWRKIEEHLKLDGQRHLLADAPMAYTRMEAITGLTITPEASLEEISPGDFARIDDIRAMLSSNALKSIAESLDFAQNAFGSPLLSSQLLHEERRFFRKYYVCKAEHSSWLVILSHYPIGLSFNRVPESAWTFPLSLDLGWESDWPSVTRTIQFNAVKLGIKLPSVRRMLRPDQPTALLPKEVALLRCIICRPEVWDIYGSKF